MAPKLEDDTVEIPITRNPLTTEQYALLCSTFNPLEMSNDCDGVDVYCAVREYVHNVLE